MAIFDSNAKNQNEAVDRVADQMHDSLKHNYSDFTEAHMENIVEALNSKLSKLGMYRASDVIFPRDSHRYASLIADSRCKVEYTGDIFGIENFTWNELEVVLTHRDIQDDFKGERPRCMYIFTRSSANKLINYLDELFVNHPKLCSAAGKIRIV